MFALTFVYKWKVGKIQYARECAFSDFISANTLPFVF